MRPINMLPPLAENDKTAIVHLTKKTGLVYKEVLGFGSYGCVVAMYDDRASRLVAAKIVRNPNIGEMKFWKKLLHPNLLPLFNIVRCQGSAVFITPIVRRTLSHTTSDKGFRQMPNSLIQVRLWLLDVINGLSYMHKTDYCHLDLKTNNILVTDNNKAMICDFGTISRTCQPLTADDVPSPRPYRPPELFRSTRMLTNRIPSQVLVGSAIDLWQFGIVGVESLTDSVLTKGEGLFYRYCTPAKYRNKTRSNFTKLLNVTQMNALMTSAYPNNPPGFVDAGLCCEFLSNFLREDPSLRTPAAIAKEHIFLQEAKCIHQTAVVNYWEVNEFMEGGIIPKFQRWLKIAFFYMLLFFSVGVCLRYLTVRYTDRRDLRENDHTSSKISAGVPKSLLEKIFGIRDFSSLNPKMGANLILDWIMDFEQKLGSDLSNEPCQVKLKSRVGWRKVNDFTNWIYSWFRRHQSSKKAIVDDVLYNCAKNTFSWLPGHINKTMQLVSPKGQPCLPFWRNFGRYQCLKSFMIPTCSSNRLLSLVQGPTETILMLYEIAFKFTIPLLILFGFLTVVVALPLMVLGEKILKANRLYLNSSREGKFRALPFFCTFLVLTACFIVAIEVFSKYRDYTESQGGDALGFFSDASKVMDQCRNDTVINKIRFFLTSVYIHIQRGLFAEPTVIKASISNWSTLSKILYLLTRKFLRAVSPVMFQVAIVTVPVCSLMALFSLLNFSLSAFSKKVPILLSCDTSLSDCEADLLLGSQFTFRSRMSRSYP